MDIKLRPVPGRERKPLDMKYVYEEIGKGRSVSAIARELNVSRATIYRRHKEHQKQGNTGGAESKQEPIYPELGDNPFE